MLTATSLAVFYIPLFFVLVRRTVREALKKLHARINGRREAQA
jgi:multidrug efflux pump